MENKVVKIGSVEMYEHEAERCYKEKKLVVAYCSVYEVVKTKYGYKGKLVYRKKRRPHEVGLTRRGRYFLSDREYVNRLIAPDTI